MWPVCCTQVARTMAPSVIYIDEAEKVFLTDKKKLKEFGSQEPFNRTKKELLKECKGMGPGERVLIIGNSREPFMCVKKDEKVGGSGGTQFWKETCRGAQLRHLVWKGADTVTAGHHTCSHHTCGHYTCGHHGSLLS